MTGAVGSTTVYPAVPVAVLPARSVAVQETDRTPRVVVDGVAQEALAMPEVASVAPGFACATWP